MPTPRRPIDTSVPTEELLRHRDRLPTGDPDRASLRARAIEQNLPLAQRLACRYAGRGELLEDLTQVAAVALVNAVDRFDASRRVPFAGFAIPSILGALKRHFRDATWAMRVPRKIQELALRIPAATEELGHHRMRSPTTADLAGSLAASVSDVRNALSARHSYRLRSLSSPSPTTGADLADVIGADDPRFDGIDNRLSLGPLVAELPLREQRILAMRFRDGMNQSQIAAAIGVSQMHVSRLLTQTLTKLRTTVAV